MPTNRNIPLEILRIFSMLGVVGIHTGGFALENPHTNIHLFFILEILSRFSVSAFFFISAFGIFTSKNIMENFSYKNFFCKHFCKLFKLYFLWSTFYFLYSLEGSGSFWQIYDDLIFHLKWGTAYYHLYFMLILLWFYLLVPLWRKILLWLRYIDFAKWFFPTLIAQILFNYWALGLKLSSDNYTLNLLLQYQLNYFPLYYLQIFIFGGWWALNYQNTTNFFQTKIIYIRSIFLLTTLIMASNYYYLILIEGQDLIYAVNKLQQLSIWGIIFALATVAWFMTESSRWNFPPRAQEFIIKVAATSSFVYFTHPLFMNWYYDLLANQGIIFYASITIAFYFASVFLPLVIYLLYYCSQIEWQIFVKRL